MMLPIAISVIQLVRPDSDKPAGRGRDNFALCLMLGIAYAASIGGIATIIGTPPNGFLIAFLDVEHGKIAPQYRMDISFAQWLKIGVPLVAVFLPVAWFMLTRVIYPVRIGEIKGGRKLIAAQLRELGRADRGQWITAIVFTCAALCWITRPLLKDLSIAGVQPLAGLSDAGIAITAGLILFAIPVNVKRLEFVMDWPTAVKLPWGLLILFGGGLSLAGAVRVNGVAEFLASFTTHVAAMPDIVIVLFVAAAVIFLTELTSNTATTATLVPILAALAPGLGVHPYLLIFPAAIAASCAFMLPVATPPNAIIFASGHVTIGQMSKAGLWLNVIGIVLVTALTMLLLEPFLSLVAPSV
jgi:sodium-dependent dicarboxylate transporter 2/3/5